MFMRLSKRIVDDEDATASIEYGIIAALIVTAIVGGVTLLGANAGNRYDGLASTVK